MTENKLAEAIVVLTDRLSENKDNFYKLLSDLFFGKIKESKFRREIRKLFLDDFERKYDLVDYVAKQLLFKSPEKYKEKIGIFHNLFLDGKNKETKFKREVPQILLNAIEPLLQIIIDNTDKQTDGYRVRIAMQDHLRYLTDLKDAATEWCVDLDLLQHVTRLASFPETPGERRKIKVESELRIKREI
jgi:hypothetical protein